MFAPQTQELAPDEQAARDALVRRAQRHAAEQAEQPAAARPDAVQKRAQAA
jgi:hypothetical protein